MPDVAFGPGQVGKWQTKSDSMEDGITADLEYSTVNADWDITDNLNFEAILSNWEQDQRQVIDFDGTEFLITTDDISQERENQTIEFHLSGTALNDRISWLAGYYSLEEDIDAALLSLGHVGVRRRSRPSRAPSIRRPVLRRCRRINAALPSTCGKPRCCLNLQRLHRAAPC